MGTPITGVIAFIGIIPIEVGNTLISVHKRAITVPLNIVIGIRALWFDELSNSLAICGTTSPRKPIGPQKAVVTAVRMPVMSNSLLRVDLIFIPRFSAYRSPSRRALSGFTINADHASPIIMSVENIGIWLIVTPLKLPSPHIT